MIKDSLCWGATTTVSDGHQKYLSYNQLLL